MTHPDTAKADTAPAAASPPTRVRKSYPLKHIAVAPENMRFGEPADEEVPQLAATIKAAGLLQPLTVRPGRKKEKPAMALDGRRRLLALEILLTAGEIDGDYPVDVFEETDPARQAAAVLLTNTAVPVHVADVIVSIGKMLKAKLTPPVIAGALGYAELDVRRLAALSALAPKAIQALRQGRINLKQAKLLARLRETSTQAELADIALKGHGFPEWRVNELLDEGSITARDRRFALVGAAAYAAAGGRTLSDLFGERADVLLDAEVLQALWTRRAEDVAGVLRAEGVEVQVTADPAPETPDDLEPFGYAYGLGLDEAQLRAWREAAAAARTSGEALSGVDLSGEGADGPLADWLRARLAADRLSEPCRAVAAAVLTPAGATGLEVVFLGPPAEAEPGEEIEDDAAHVSASTPPRVEAAAEPVAAASEAETEGVNHALHEVRTDTATRALIRALADDPTTALAALIARLFGVVVLRSGLAKGGGALTVTADAYSRPRAPVIEPLDGEVRRRLADRRAAWEASGKTPIGWVSGLPHGEKMTLLAELVALSLDLREERTTCLRRAARSEAAEIAALCSADVTLYWTPDEAFLRPHSKAQLLAMLEAMGAGVERARALKKDELVALAAEEAAARLWAPAWLSWAAPVEDEDTDNEAAAAEAPPVTEVVADPGDPLPAPDTLAA